MDERSALRRGARTAAKPREFQSSTVITWCDKLSISRRATVECHMPVTVSALRNFKVGSALQRHATLLLCEHVNTIAHAAAQGWSPRRTRSKPAAIGYWPASACTRHRRPGREFHQKGVWRANFSQRLPQFLLRVGQDCSTRCPPVDDTNWGGFASPGTRFALVCFRYPEAGPILRGNRA